MRTVFLIFLVYQSSLQYCRQRLPSWCQDHQCQCLIPYELFFMMTLSPKETLLHFLLAILSDICSFQSDLLWNKLRIIILLSSMNGDASSIGLYIELSNDKISCLFKVFPFLCTSKYSQCSFIIGNSF